LKPEASDKHYVNATRMITGVMTILLTGIAVITAYWVLRHPETTMISIALSIITYTYGSLLGIFLLGMLTKTRGNDKGNAIAAVLGIMIVLTVKVLTPVSWIWFILIGTITTFCTGVLFKSPSKQTDYHS
ncbi:MAG: hypothetical protein GY863_21450, partial [bacterium]|nr:hypothetical protein [bacterium]